MQIHRLGAYSWLLALPLFFAANVITGLAWEHPRFSWATNNISDLGNVTCGVWDTTRPREVCSPWHTAMNSAMIATGVLLTLGVLLSWSALGRGVATRAAQVVMLAGAAGFALVGAYPADVDENRHFLAAILIFVLGNAGILAAAPSPGLRSIRPISIALGLAGLTATALFLAQVDLGLGVGGMERLAVFPLPIWTFAVAIRRIAEG